MYGAGFYYIPGTDTCLKVGGFVRAEVNFNAGGSFAPLTSGDFDSRNNGNKQTWRSRAGITVDARSQTEYGTLRAYTILASTSTNSQAGAATGGGAGVGNPGGSGTDPYTRLWSNAAFIQFAGFTAGKTGSFFDFDNIPYSNQTNFWGTALGGGGIEVFGYTAQLGNGLSASIAAENAAGHRYSILSTNGVGGVTTTWQYGNQSMPDLVANLRVDQAWGSAQVMAAYHEVRGVNVATMAETATATSSGYGLGAGLKVNLPMLGKGDYIQAQFGYAKGALMYIAGAGASIAMTSNLTTVNHVGQLVDAVVTTGNNLDLTTGWSVTGGFEHFWNPSWKTSLYGSYGKVSYSSAASAQLVPATALATSSANWSLWQVGSRTVWTPVTNLDLSVDVMYQGLSTAYSTGTGTYSDKSWWSGMFRAQRNFYP